MRGHLGLIRGDAAVTRRRGYPDEHISSGLEWAHTEFIELGDGLAQGQV
jgi:hypothetical protein